VVTSLMERPRILLNSGGNGNHWLTLELVGRYSNRDAIGAKVKLTTAAGRVLYNHVSVSTGSCLRATSECTLGWEAKSRSPPSRSGGREARSRPQDVAADQFLKVEESPSP